MKAFVVEKYGKSGLRAAQAPDPTIGPRDVLVRVSAASINPLDTLIRNGEFKLLLKYKTPFVLGHDLSGIVTRVGAEVRGYKPPEPYKGKGVRYVGETVIIKETKKK